MWKLTHTRLLVTDFQASFEFYHRLLGLSVVHGDGSGPYAELDVGDSLLALFSKEAMAEAMGDDHYRSAPGTAPAVALIFQVNDVDEVARGLEAKGVPVASPPTDRVAWGTRTAMLEDPDGNLVELYSVLA